MQTQIDSLANMLSNIKTVISAELATNVIKSPRTLATPAYFEQKLCTNNMKFDFIININFGILSPSLNNITLLKWQNFVNYLYLLKKISVWKVLCLVPNKANRQKCSPQKSPPRHNLI